VSQGSDNHLLTLTLIVSGCLVKGIIFDIARFLLG